MSVNLTDEQRAELLDIYPRVRTGVSDSVDTTARMIRLHNQIYGTGYKERSRCNSCLAMILRNIGNLYEENKA